MLVESHLGIGRRLTHPQAPHHLAGKRLEQRFAEFDFPGLRCIRPGVKLGRQGVEILDGLKSASQTKDLLAAWNQIWHY
jgi:hypothetical protein